MTKKIMACVDGSTLSEAVCDFGAFFSKTLHLPLELLNVVEHLHVSTQTDLSGNIGLGARDDLLETLIDEEKSESKKAIVEGKKMLSRLQERVLSQEAKAVKIVQKHGELYENVQAHKEEIRLLILGLRGKDHENQAQAIGSQVEELIRTLNVPILLVNEAFSEPKKILIAYDGSPSSKKAIDMVAKEPLFNHVERHMVNVYKDKALSSFMLEEATHILETLSFSTLYTASLQGDPIKELLNYQKENSIDLIAMGAFSHSRIRDALFGSFTSKMILSTPKPLLLLR
ncbi:MAG: universal stress protein [Campylobacterales bacterium]|nr:universal stress protein [Campylobacterales bacterium]MBN2832633.1 universal stress protein [Campylobacterales bacterium]